jgi:uncharacterized protein YbjQ (UPF0145 family)
MPLKFRCPRCRKPVITYLRVGEQARCRACGSDIAVPESATSTDEKPEHLSEGLRQKAPPKSPVLFSTTPTLQHRDIAEYLGVVSSEAILGANVLRDLVAEVTDIVGGRAGVYEEKLREAKALVLEGLADEARSLGANAVVGVDLDYETVGSGASMLMVAASGTAVLLKPRETEGESASQEG